MTHEPETNGESEPESLPAEAERPETVSINAEEWDQLQQECSEFKDKYLRALAEMENARKRMLKEKRENSQQAVADVIADFLRPLDNMENALKFAENMSKDIQNWATGFKMILSQFKEILESNGVSPIVSTGRPFDPHMHEAIETVESAEYAPGTIVEEYTRGYRMGEKIIRPARVKVTKAVSQQNDSAADQSDKE